MDSDEENMYKLKGVPRNKNEIVLEISDAEDGQIDSDCEIVASRSDTEVIEIDCDSPLKNDKNCKQRQPICVDSPAVDETDILVKGHAIEIKFQDENIYEELHKEIVNGMTGVLQNLQKANKYQFDFIVDNVQKSIFVDYSLKDTPVGVVDEDTPVASTRSERAITPDFSDLAQLFTIDTEPSPTAQANIVPSYKRCMKDILDGDAERRKRRKIEEETKCPRPRPTHSCFNCGSMEHALRECPKPRNGNRINRNKKTHMHKQERYHQEVEQRFGQFKPGVCSSALRTALGLKRNEIPFFIYRMRVVGYPPGWLEHAKIMKSGLTLFNADGSAIPNGDDELQEDFNDSDIKYDASKIIEYPGYNIKCAPKFYDDYKYYSVPPYNPEQSKKEFIKALGNKVVDGSYKIKKLKNFPAAHDERTDDDNLNDSTWLILDDMEIEDQDLTTEDISLTNNTDSPTPQNESTLSLSRNSPTLDDLETQQKVLLEQLESSKTNISVMEDDSLATETIDNTKSDSNTINSTTESSILKPTTHTPANTFIESYIGTPIAKDDQKLPTGEQFKEGVSEVINFENLPDSTGKYEELKVILKNVRSKITKLRED